MIRELKVENKENSSEHTYKSNAMNAALKMKVSKKSLDDYKLQINLGKQFGFDFEKHHNSKVGVLR